MIGAHHSSTLRCAQKWGNTPWGIMDDNRCIGAEVRARSGYEPMCAVMSEETGFIHKCDGDCVEGRCAGHGDL